MPEIVIDFILRPSGAFLLVFIGTLCLFSEVLVKGRFIFALSGLCFISMYFVRHTEGTQNLWIWVVSLYIIGMLFVVIDGKLIGDGTLATIGLILVLISLALPSPTILHGLSVATAFLLGIVGAFFLSKYLPRRNLWSKLALRHTMTSEQGYNAMNTSYNELVGKRGIAQTNFRPTGVIRINNHDYSATGSGWIKKGTTSKVVEVNGTRILVEKENE